MKLAIVVPYRNREEHLIRFIPHIVSYFHRDKSDSSMKPLIVIAEQVDDLPFNRGALKNAAFLEVEREHDVVCFHDIDYLPIWADYSDPKDSPTRIIWWGMHERPVRVGGKEKVMAPHIGLGTVTLIQSDLFWRVNGFSNNYYGWGFEDTDLQDRFQKCLEIYPAQRDGTFEPLDHDNEGYNADGSKSEAWLKNEQIFNSQSQAYSIRTLPAEGLNNIKAMLTITGRFLGREVGLDWTENLQSLHLHIKLNSGKANGI